MEDIDFVLTWVDGSDPAWLAEKKRWENGGAAEPRAGGDANADCRYRDNGLLRYWFRAVERFAPWVDRVFFVTCGQKPDWLDLSCPKLRFVEHRDYLPPEWLPTFNARTINLNLHRIRDLSERFVLFDDDMFLLRPVAPRRYFRKGRPVLDCDLGAPDWLGCSNISRVVVNNAGVLKRGLDVDRLLRKRLFAFADARTLGFARAAKNVVSFAVNRTWIPGAFGHLPQPHLKSTFEEIWRVLPEPLERTSRGRFRRDDDVNHWLACAWNVVAGRFIPANAKRLGRHVSLAGDGFLRVCDAVRRRACLQMCMNDAGAGVDPEKAFSALREAFDSILPDKSSFEIREPSGNGRRK